ncbi:uncharacterized protein BX663DRAFT_430641 [Cokeromyces recurvatus]|uniref:uncharacterized protein n=1 Tax=Cokeromyces recurvatus TaxID=90255 RepID=UPI00221EC526|nr:uncharacterized protein BX663DRAFT_430641 [Cokeromyces recurvatus]KAI7905109.1 hypothetical protein BX663DRAFT_430641 [Cokeromyces recurvatus]
MVNHYYNTEKIVQISSPDSTERLLFNYLCSKIEKKYQDTIKINYKLIKEQQPLFPTWDDTFLSLEEDTNIILELNTFSDLLIALKDIEEIEPYSTTSRIRALASQQRKPSVHWPTAEDDLIHMSNTTTTQTTEFMTIPPSVRLDIESSSLLEVLMNRAVQHWCCIKFKVAPISVDLVKNWQKTPKAIIYCIASISLVTIRDEQSRDDNDVYPKQAAMVFYEQARNKLDDILFDDMQPFILQSYFCLSYTSNLLRLYEQQRTWGSLASISLQHLATRAAPIDELSLKCYLRWYYVDAWMCLTMNRECLLPDHIPWINIDSIDRPLTHELKAQHDVYHFAQLARYMRRYIRALYSDNLFVYFNQQKRPSKVYYEITKSLIGWYSKLPKLNTFSDLHLCYHSMRLLVLYQFLHPNYPPTEDILVDCLQTNLELLQALQHLRTLGCDQSTYHHMFLAIHNTAKRIFNYDDTLSVNGKIKSYAEEQLKINLMLLKSTQAYAHDVFKMKMYAQRIQDQFSRMKITTINHHHHRRHFVGGNTFVFKQSYNETSNNYPIFISPSSTSTPTFMSLFSHYQQATPTHVLPSSSIIVFKHGKDHDLVSKPKKRTKKKKM